MRALPAVIGAVLAMMAASASALEFKPYPTANITEAQWTAYYEEVKAAYAPSAQTIAAQNLVIYSGKGVHYAFTQAAHAAHPAWITRQLVEQNGRFHVAQIGYFAGQEAPFAKLFRDFEALNKQMIEQMERDRAKK